MVRFASQPEILQSREQPQRDAFLEPQEQRPILRQRVIQRHMPVFGRRMVLNPNGYYSNEWYQSSFSNDEAMQIHAFYDRMLELGNEEQYEPLDIQKYPKV